MAARPPDTAAVAALARSAHYLSLSQQFVSHLSALYCRDAVAVLSPCAALQQKALALAVQEQSLHRAEAAVRERLKVLETRKQEDNAESLDDEVLLRHCAARDAAELDVVSTLKAVLEVAADVQAHPQDCKETEALRSFLLAQVTRFSIRPNYC